MAESQSQLGFEPIAAEHPALYRLLTELRGIYLFGGALLGCFQVSGPPTLCANWLLELFGIEARQEIERFLSSAEVATALPELRTQEGIQPAEWTRVGALAFGGMLGDTLLYGGYARDFPGTYQEARELAHAASDAIFGDRWHEVFIWITGRAWSWWFGDILWDRTWMVADRGHERLWLLCTMDSD
jgi:hypothetical protein